MPQFTTHPDMIVRIKDAAKKEALMRSLGTADALMGEDGNTWGDLPATGADVIGYYNDLVEHVEPVPVPVDPQIAQDPAWMQAIAQYVGGTVEVGPDGLPVFMVPETVRTLDMLHFIDEAAGAKHAERLDREYERAMARMTG